MLVKTRGIVLNFIRYRETSIIVNVYTEELGRISCIVNGVRSIKSKNNKIALYQPLTLLDLVVYDRSNQSLHRISEAKIAYPFRDIPFDIIKTSMAIFLTEVLTKMLHEEERNEELFDFLSYSIEKLDEMQEHYANFHLQFLIQLTDYMGFGISSLSDFIAQLSIVEASEASLKLLSQLLQDDGSSHITANGKTRNEVLHWLLGFYQLHFDNFGKIKSLEVLRELQR